MYCNYNVTTYPMKIVKTYPKGEILLEIPVHQKPHVHKAVTIPSIWTAGILHFPIVSISSCSGIFLAQGEFSKMYSER